MGMNLTKTDVICGLSASTARDLLHRLGWNFDAAYFREAVTFVITRHQHKHPSVQEVETAKIAPGLLAAFVEAGFAVEAQPGEYETTKAGRELANSTFLKRMPRKEALAKLRGFMDRVRDINSDASPYMVYVQNAWLYGSLITDAPDIGDIDLIVETKVWPRISSTLEFAEARIKTLGKSPQTLDAYAFCWSEVTKELKGRQPHIQLNGFSHYQLHEITGGYRQIVKDGVLLMDALPIEEA
jgi:hypothetical protein